jgi:hypothetical protein
MFSHGQQIELVYPTLTHILHINDAPRTVRQLYVHRVRDLVREPLTPSEFLRRPYVARGRWLILASEFAGERPKQFYPSSADNFRAPGTLRLALYEPGFDYPIRFLGKQIEPTPHDRRHLLRLIHRVADTHDGYDLRIVADDLRITG